MRNYENFDRHLDALLDDIYDQPADGGHDRWARRAIQTFGEYVDQCESVLDVGCGSGFCEPMFANRGLTWTGVTLGKDADKAKALGRPIHKLDMTFLNYPDETYDLVFARHVLEHSPFPLITLMEWRRVAKKYLLLIAPAPEHWGYRGRNHYAVMNQDQIVWLCERAGWSEVASTVMSNHSPEYLNTLPDETERDNARRIRPALPVEYRYLFEVAEPQEE